jgi:histidinol phosphate phosphatase HisJ family
MKIYDSHTHSQYSPDSRTNIEELVSTAAQKNFAGIAITDHLDIDAPRINDSEDEKLFIFDPILQQNEIDEVSSRYDINILKGIEIGLQPKSIQKIKSFCSQYKFDCVIASIHYADGEDPYFGHYYDNKDYTRAYRRILELIYQTAIAFSDFDILGHFDYITRYSPYKEKEIKYNEFSDYLEPILRFLAHEGKALEINTKTYTKNSIYTPSLDIKILKKYKEFGGEAISLGSDAHDATLIGDNFEKYVEIIKKCGFKYLTYYKERKPIFYPIK